MRFFCVSIPLHENKSTGIGLGREDEERLEKGFFEKVTPKLILEEKTKDYVR